VRLGHHLARRGIDQHGPDRRLASFGGRACEPHGALHHLKVEIVGHAPI
jgi:hypothetical protein